MWIHVNPPMANESFQTWMMILDLLSRILLCFRLKSMTFVFIVPFPARAVVRVLRSPLMLSVLHVPVQDPGYRI
jgi:hypothetical protein